MRESVEVEHPDVARTRAGYDAVAEQYAAMFAGAMAERPFDRAVLAAFADLVRGTGSVADIGCGPGRITGDLRDLGLDVFGIDLSPEMVRLARRAHPDLRFEEGTMTALALPDRSLAGIVAWYSVIHTPPERLPAILAEFDRVLTDDGRVVLAFQTHHGDEDVIAHEHAVAPAYWWSVPGLEKALRANGFRPIARMSAEPVPPDRGPQGYLVAARSDAG
ncbi:class I SAM-dependent DNA methyltransferase [Nocardia sp. NPDC003482]